MLSLSARLQTCALVLTLGGLGCSAACAETVADFYKGKTVNVLIGVGAGGEYDLQARLVARFHRQAHSGQSDRGSRRT